MSNIIHCFKKGKDFPSFIAVNIHDVLRELILAQATDALRIQDLIMFSYQFLEIIPNKQK